MARLSPVLPLIGAETRFQPVYVDDVAAAAAKARARARRRPGIYELGGPEVATFRELMERMLGDHPAPPDARRLPFWLARLDRRRLLDLASRLSFGLSPTPC